METLTSSGLTYNKQSFLESFIHSFKRVFKKKEKSNLVRFAEQEFKHLGWDMTDKMNKAMVDGVINLLKTFSDEGHSGMSASYASELFYKLSKFEPLSPLTGEDSEWNEVGDGIYQNRRCFHVFKDSTHAYDIDGKIFREPDGSCYTNFNSRVDITFPYTPKREYVDRPSSTDESTETI